MLVFQPFLISSEVVTKAPCKLLSATNPQEAEEVYRKSPESLWWYPSLMLTFPLECAECGRSHQNHDR